MNQAERRQGNISGRADPEIGIEILGPKHGDLKKIADSNVKVLKLPRSGSLLHKPVRCLGSRGDRVTGRRSARDLCAQTWMDQG